MTNINGKTGGWKSILIFAGSYISYYFGSGYATGQDLMQYYLRFAYGWHFLLGPMLALVIFWYYNRSFTRAGAREKFKRHGDIFTYYCGKIIGLAFDIFIIISCGLCYMVMCSGAAATLAQQFAMPEWLGAVIFCFFVVTTNIFGLRGIVRVLGQLGPILIVSVFLISLFTLARSYENIPEGFRLIREGNLGQISIGPNLWIGSIFHSVTVIGWFAAFSAELGARSDLKELSTGIVLACFAVLVTTTVGSFALIGNIKEVATAAIPNLILANRLSPLLGNFFAFIVLGSVYTTAVPLLWTTSSRFAGGDLSRRFRLITVGVGVLGLLMALYVPYRSFINIIYTLCSYIGIVMLLFMLLRDARFFLAGRKFAKAAEASGGEGAGGR
ncbi:hypothetical protein [Cloacibacillus porcorum]|uniref:YkvI family membrane protein n=1 Tax=Cloacibacillus porcorum TaxID=1197717 RepID=UPI0023F1D9F5|nr:hypothetical protein [Cloacibacillus porcorum]MDD7650640.1 hypothetical protein [Cloacibacillus porcorum]MDY4092577.1 hypothetical protein [Cloacibacillus porcorum]